MRRFQETGNVKRGDQLCAAHRRLYILGQTATLIAEDRAAVHDRRWLPAGCIVWMQIASLEIGHALHMVQFGPCPEPACRMDP